MTRRLVIALSIAFTVILAVVGLPPSPLLAPAIQAPPAGSHASSSEALLALEDVPVKGRSPKTGYARSHFGAAWTDSNSTVWGNNSLSTREDILSRDLQNISCKPKQTEATPPCVVQTGQLRDPYTGTHVEFTRGQTTSSLVPIDHVVSLSDAWQKGAQQLSKSERINLANDPLNLIATTQQANSSKGDSDAATWLVPNKSFRCDYVSRQIAVKLRYKLWITKSEKTAIRSVLAECPGQYLPSSEEITNRSK